MSVNLASNADVCVCVIKVCLFHTNTGCKGSRVKMQGNSCGHLSPRRVSSGPNPFNHSSMASPHVCVHVFVLAMPSFVLETHSKCF